MIRCEKLDRRQLQAWLNNRFSESGIQILAKDARYMVDICGTSLANLSNEADKLELYIGKSKHNISRSDIDVCVQKDTELKVYDILDLIKRKDLANAQLELKQLKERNESRDADIIDNDRKHSRSASMPPAFRRAVVRRTAQTIL